MSIVKNKLMRLCTVLIMLTPVLGGCSMGEYRPLKDDDVILLQQEDIRLGEDLALVETSLGSFTLRFFPSEAPTATENFIMLAQTGYFNGQSVYSIDLDGDEPNAFYAGSADGGKSGFTVYGESFDAEISANLWPFSGAVAAPSDRWGQADSRFFVVSSKEVPEDVLDTMTQNGFPPKVVEAFRENGGVPGYSLRATIFAQVFDGMNVVEAILSAPHGTDSRPLEDIIIKQVTIYKYEGAE